MFRSQSGRQRWNRIGWFDSALFIFLTFASLASARTSADRIRIRNATFETRVELPGGRVSLRGATLCRYLGFKVYTAAFYTTPDARNLDEILDTAPKRLELYYNRGIDREDIVEAFEETLRSNPRINLASLRSRLDLMYGWFEDVREGDRFRLDYTPGEGSALYFNGRLKGVIAGEDFARAYYGIWLSDYSLSRTYRDRLLGL